MAAPVVEVAGFHNDGLAVSDAPSVPNTIRDGKAIEGVATEEFPRLAAEALQRWNKPRMNIWRFAVTNYCFYMMGLNDAAVGALIPYLEVFYGIDYTVVALIFLAPFLGYTLAAFLNNQIHLRFGQRGVTTIAPCCKIVAYIVICLHPPYPVIIVISTLSGFGIGLEDGGFNAWVGNMEHANELLGILHASYGLGATIGPLIATAMVTKGSLPWYIFYYLMVSGAVFELVVGPLVFWSATGSAHRAAQSRGTNSKTNSTREAASNPITWLCAIFLFGYVGVEVTFGGWLVTFMLRVRNGEDFASGITVTGFWLGLTIGRVILGFVTGQIGEKLAVVIYLLMSMALELLFWLIPSFTSSAICAALLGFSLSNLFPAAIVVTTKLLPKRLHLSSIGFAAAFGGGGAALFPFAVGAIAQAKGVEVLQPIALALIAAILVIWCVLPGGFKKGGLELAQVERDQRLRMDQGHETVGKITRFMRKFGFI